MAISFQRYIDIVSGVAAGTVVRLRELIGRFFTVNPLLPTQSFVEFETAEEVGLYFGTDSEEYARAVFYFGWVSKLITRPTKISFARWADEDTAPLIFGASATQSLANWTGITDGAFDLTLGPDTNSISGLDFSTAVDLDGVASIIEAAIQAETGTLWTAASVAYDPIRGSFNLTGGAVGPAVVAVGAPATGTNLLAAGLLGWTSNAIFSDGVAAETVTDTITASANASSNFGSFAFMPALSLEEVVDLSAWNTAQNNRYIFSHAVLEVDAADYFEALSGYSGVALTEKLTAGEYPEQVPMMILAATDYTRRNSVQSYMYQVFNLTPSVTTDAKANTLDAARVNYYGRTQTAGQFIDFYQRGVLMGLPSAATDMNIYANEIWLKDRIGAAIMELFLNLPQISANAEGRGFLLTTIQGVGIADALNNGTISVGKTLNNSQKLFIASITGVPDAWQQVQTLGYWLDCTIVSEVVGPNTVYKAEYLLVYAKNDAISKVEGTHTLI